MVSEVLIVVAAGLFGGFIGATVGGGALVVIPALVFVGMPAHIAVATTRLGALPMAVVSAQQYHKSEMLDVALALRFSVLAFLGAIIGANLMVEVDEETLKRCVGVMILGIGALVVLRPSLGILSGETPSLGRKGLGYFLVFLIGVWGGFFGGGYAVLGGYVVMLCFHRSFLESAAILKVVGLALSLIAVVVYLSHDLISWPTGVLLGISMALGGFWGTRWGLESGDSVVRKLFIFVTFVSGVALIVR